jgi:predicted DCC family thiol-disulfide oxidoreductase YuxK
MQKLHVLYDPRCELCCHLRDWIVAQSAWIDLELMPVGCEEARRKFPELEQIATRNDLAVISDEGEVYLNDRAWIMVLYALYDYRDWAARLTHPLLMPMVRQAFAAISMNRGVLSRWLYGRRVETIAEELRKVIIEPCPLPERGVPCPDIRDYLQ